ncbi:CoA transferase [Thermoleophilia bacterium SCSIO 60948]|nr:CoA transferase [Thermoleophilia bacterium SCSIO 60948]
MSETHAGSRPQGAGALSDITVLDLTRLLPGGFASLMLADLGADVIKVEDTGAGDYVRWSPPFHGDEDSPSGTRSALYLGLNRGKRSIRLDLKSDAGRAAMLELVAEADVVLDGFRPGVMDRLGLGYQTLRERNRGIVVCSITGYGSDGPNVARAGHDINYLSLNGMLGLAGSRDGAPTLAGGQIADVGGGALFAAFAVMAALWERRRSGEGQFIDVSMTDGSLSWLAMQAAAVLCDGTDLERGAGPLNGGIACYLTYECADGWVACGALEPKFWARFCEGTGHPELVADQFAPTGSDGWRRVADVFAGRAREDWRQFNDEHDCCIEPVLGLAEALDSELVAARGMRVSIDQPGVGEVEMLGSPLRLSRTPADPTRPAPALGADTRAVLIGAGLSEADVERLIADGAAATDAEEAGGSFLG